MRHANEHDNFALHYSVPPRRGMGVRRGFLELLRHRQNCLITADMIQKHMPPPGKDTQILLCEPSAMMKVAVMPAIEKLEYTKDMFLQRC
jgi:cytochrome-b5 reductase